MTTSSNGVHRLYRYYRPPPLAPVTLGRPAVVIPKGEAEPLQTSMVISMNPDGAFTTLKEIWLPEILDDVYSG